MSVVQKKAAITYECLQYLAADVTTLTALRASYGSAIRVTNGIVFLRDDAGVDHELADTDRAVKLLGDDTFVEVLAAAPFAAKYILVSGTTYREKTTVTYNADQYLAANDATLENIIARIGIDNIEVRSDGVFVFSKPVVDTDRVITRVSDVKFIEVANVTKYTDEYEISL